MDKCKGCPLTPDICHGEKPDCELPGGEEMIFNIEEQKEYFKNHVAEFTDYGNIKILDFKDPESEIYRIRFLFEEDYCRLHISGDLGHLVATNYNNMKYEHFDEFTRDPGYFRQKIDCHDRDIYVYDAERAVKDLREYFGDEDGTTITEDEINKILYDFSGRYPISHRQREVVAGCSPVYAPK